MWTKILDTGFIASGFIFVALSLTILSSNVSTKAFEDKQITKPIESVYKVDLEGPASEDAETINALIVNQSPVADKKENVEKSSGEDVESSSSFQLSPLNPVEAIRAFGKILATAEKAFDLIRS